MSPKSVVEKDTKQQGGNMNINKDKIESQKT